MFICRSTYQSGKSFLTNLNTFSVIVTKGIVTYHTFIVKCGTGGPPYTLFQYPQFTAARKNSKIKEIKGS
jgi:hypothetical protein